MHVIYCLIPAIARSAARCLGLRAAVTSANCATDACPVLRRSIDRPSLGPVVQTEILLRRSFAEIDTPQIFVILTAVVGMLAMCGIVVVVLWYRRGGAESLSRAEEGFSELDDKVPLSAQYIAPPPRIYAGRWESVVGSTIPSAAQPPPSRKGRPNLVISIPSRRTCSWNLERVPVPRLSSPPSAAPRMPLVRMRLALRTPRQQDFHEGPRRSLSLEPNLALIDTLKQENTDRASSSDVLSGVPNPRLPSQGPMTSRLAALMDGTRRPEYNV
ncbi:hypothetical protein B0H15DRAFT_525523 [Mycena belliarum]|uniref:Uncharacterized protein n=1 Tax=Mycena belliarum TaxID=1033014 RepID=A0AAD6XPJ8_9AGAR|nr:hypothetical protein B0H15DRAFT_525523 [Mycena belliae]